MAPDPRHRPDAGEIAALERLFGPMSDNRLIVPSRPGADANVLREAPDARPLRPAEALDDAVNAGSCFVAGA
ncbi:hypothetical protein [Amycolatopsis thailandensis]|uniref:hypothetical protein n=1 Tax=Amycolatopsis thailandensis TaxID=589330 RepID=UPI00364513B2